MILIVVTPSAHEETAKLLNRLLAKGRADRCANATEIVQAFENALQCARQPAKA